jgi:homoserine kinase
MRRVRAFGPASIGNFAAGFDVLGAAIAPVDGELLGDWVEVGEAAAPAFRCEGPFSHRLPPDPEDNLALKARDAFARAWGRALPPLDLRLHKGLPVGSGLGSSSATVVATLVALNAFLGVPLSTEGLLRAAGEAEGHGCGSAHLDNVAPALLGGLRLVDPGGRVRGLPFPEGLRLVVASPDLELTTRAAREVLPREVPLALAVRHAQNLASLVHALHAGDAALRRDCLRDLLAEPHRAALVPGFQTVKAAALEAGAEGCTFSGAGPALFAVAAAPLAEGVGARMVQAWAGAGVKAVARCCAVDARGARVLEEA